MRGVGQKTPYWNVGCETLMQAINRQRLDAEAEDPVYRFCSHIKEALIQGKAYLEDVSGSHPIEPKTFQRGPGYSQFFREALIFLLGNPLKVNVTGGIVLIG